MCRRWGTPRRSKSRGNSMLAAQKMKADRSYAMAARTLSFTSTDSNNYHSGGGRRSNLAKGGGHHNRHNSSSPQSEDGGSESDPSVYKTRLCVRFSTPEGCRYGEKCRFAHGKSDLRPGGKSDARLSPVHDVSVRSITSSIDGLSTGEYSRQSSNISLDALSSLQVNGGYHHPGELSSPASSTGTSRLGFGSSSTSRKMNIGAAFAGAVIGKAGANVKEINRMTGAKVSIRDHGTDPNLKSVEMEGSPEQIEQASEMVKQYMENKELLSSKTSAVGSRTFKTKICKNFIQGTCTFADRCHFAHGAYELRGANLG